MSTDPNPERADYLCLGQSVQLWSDASPKNAIPDMLLLERMTIFESRRPYREMADANADGLIATQPSHPGILPIELLADILPPQTG